MKLFQRGLFSSGGQAHTERAHVQTALLFKTQGAHTQIQTVGGQTLQANACVNVLDSQMGRIQTLGSGRLIKCIILNVAPTYDNGIDAQVERFLFCLVLGRKSVNNKLEIRGTVFLLLVQMHVCIKQGDGAQGHVAAQDGHYLHLGRKQAGLEHRLARLVFEYYVVECSAIEQAQLYAPDADLCLQYFGKPILYLARQPLLGRAKVDQDEEQKICAKNKRSEETNYFTGVAQGFLWELALAVFSDAAVIIHTEWPWRVGYVR